MIIFIYFLSGTYRSNLNLIVTLSVFICLQEISENYLDKKKITMQEIRIKNKDKRNWLKHKFKSHKSTILRVYIRREKGLHKIQGSVSQETTGIVKV